MYESYKREILSFFSILVFMSSGNFKLSSVEHKKSFITSGQDSIFHVG